MVEQDPKPVVTVEETDEIVARADRFVTVVVRPRKVYGGMWGPLEIGAVAAGALVVLLAAVVFFFWVIPSDRELARNKSEADRLDAELISAKAKYGEITDTETEVGKIVASIDDFEARFLPLPSTGQSALYQRLNGLLAAHGLTNTTGPDYSPLETADQETGPQSDDEKGRGKYRSLYPGVYVSTTLEGTYQNLRRFIREIETGREFIIVSAVELAPSDTQADRTKQNPNAPFDGGQSQNFGSQGGFSSGQPIAKARPKGKTHGEIVSLHIEMAAYFRRPRTAPNVQ